VKGDGDMVETICGILCVVFGVLCVALLGLCIFLVVLTRRVYAAHVATTAWAVKLIDSGHKFYHDLIQQKEKAHREDMLVLESHLTNTISSLTSQSKSLMEWVVVFLHDEEKKRNPDSPSVNVVPAKKDEEVYGGPVIGGKNGQKT